ncbi:MAG TPA: RNHCP domain-containing protein [Oligoflexia bacterium]|nr:RNHCP domain-containing protein [Oligoflexia bacterium]HMP27081.1 RNHCP domain-containing protein [Oligoflexia bacterium]
MEINYYANKLHNKKFTKIIENFDCEACGTKVAGNGYTNHCPECLVSKHVDCNPGDRANPCAGLMEAIAIRKKHNQIIIIHRCLRCGSEKETRAAKNDNFKRLLQLPLVN